MGRRGGSGFWGVQEHNSNKRILVVDTNRNIFLLFLPKTVHYKSRVASFPCLLTGHVFGLIFSGYHAFPDYLSKQWVPPLEYAIAMDETLEEFLASAMVNRLQLFLCYNLHICVFIGKYKPLGEQAYHPRGRRKIGGSLQQHCAEVLTGVGRPPINYSIANEPALRA